MAVSTWQGTDQELVRLRVALAHHCDCIGGMLGLPSQTCSAHQLLEHQRALDHLLYVYRVRRVFITREFYAFPMSQPGQRGDGRTQAVEETR